MSPIAKLCGEEKMLWNMFSLLFFQILAEIRQ